VEAAVVSYGVRVEQRPSFHCEVFLTNLGDRPGIVTGVYLSFVDDSGEVRTFDITPSQTAAELIVEPEKSKVLSLSFSLSHPEIEGHSFTSGQIRIGIHNFDTTHSRRVLPLHGEHTWS
jgi:hypothetical protein